MKIRLFSMQVVSQADDTLICGRHSVADGSSGSRQHIQKRESVREKLASDPRTMWRRSSVSADSPRVVQPLQLASAMAGEVTLQGFGLSFASSKAQGKYMAV